MPRKAQQVYAFKSGYLYTLDKPFKIIEHFVMNFSFLIASKDKQDTVLKSQILIAFIEFAKTFISLKCILAKKYIFFLSFFLTLLGFLPRFLLFFLSFSLSLFLSFSLPLSLTFVPSGKALATSRSL